MRSAAESVTATVELVRAGAPEEIQVKVRIPKKNLLTGTSVNGNPAEASGPHTDTVAIKTGRETRFALKAELS
ncbi:MAG TPA: hypothetical protein VH596_07205 [Terriglobales bacterium]|jgi:hypothetical protein